MDQAYRVAEHVFRVKVADDFAPWAYLKSHYEPFAIAEASEHPTYEVEIIEGEMPNLASAGYQVVMDEESNEKWAAKLCAYSAPDGSTAYTVQQPVQEVMPAMPQACLMLNPDLTKAKIFITSDKTVGKFVRVTTLTTCMLLCFSLCTGKTNTLVAHASTAVRNGKAYLFIAKSGTGKSTHCQLWLKNVPGAWQLNDDHPIVRVYADGRAIAYGSPWSGKTDVYINDSYPIGAIVRIQRAKHNELKRQTPLQAYASLSTSFSGIKWDRAIADKRHQTIEALVADVPCYVMECLPDDEAALVCSAGV